MAEDTNGQNVVKKCFYLLGAGDGERPRLAILSRKYHEIAFRVKFVNTQFQ